MSNTLPVFQQPKPPMQVSKWLQIPVLIDFEELESLLSAIGNFEIFLASGLLPQGEGLISQEEFLDCYRSYIGSLEEGRIPDDPRISRYFSAVWTKTREALYAVPVAGERQMIKVQKPVVQLQHHRFAYGADKKFRSMVLGEQSIVWGIQFSYPQLFQDEAHQVIKIRENGDFPNSALFKAIQRWIREWTLPTPVVVEGVKTNLPIRLGKQCFSWIDRHPQLGLLKIAK